MNEFVNNYTLSILKSLKNVQLWQFSVSKTNSYNIKKELYELEKNNIGLWSKPSNYEKYEDKNNILLITDEEYTYIILFNECNSSNKITGRKWWNNIHKENGIIEIKLLGILHYEKQIIEEACNYKRFSIANKFQPIKKVTYREFINNLESLINECLKYKE